MKLNLLVIRASVPDRNRQFYERLLDCKFVHHRHGKGPFHYSAELEGFVFEIYPLLKTQSEPDISLRLGFTVDNLQALLATLQQYGTPIVQNAHTSEWGFRAIVQDPDGRKIELCETIK